MKHPVKVENYNGSLDDLAKEIGNLSYNILSDLISKLADDIKGQADADYKKNRTKLAAKLYLIAGRLYGVKENIDEAWDICKPYMKDDANK